MTPYPKALLALLLCSGMLAGQTGTPATDPRYQELVAKERAENITAAEVEELKSLALKYRGAYMKAHPPRESTGLAPLPDLGRGPYRGEEGGLYPGGSNVPPPAHLAAGLVLAHAVRPLGKEGRPDIAGKIVLLGIGMSNTGLDFRAFQRLAANLPGRNPAVVLVNACQGGNTADKMAEADGNFWRVVAQRLAHNQVSPAQVQVAWIKNTVMGPLPAFPENARKLQGYLRQTVHILGRTFPNLKIAYLASRTYAGYAMSPLNPEPLSYETGFAVKWLIADQIGGDAELNHNPAIGTVRAPWLAWGPYLWADGVKGRKGDGLVYTREDYVIDDGTHPAKSGREKVGRLLLDFFRSDPTTRPWFLK